MRIQRASCATYSRITTCSAVLGVAGCVLGSLGLCSLAEARARVDLGDDPCRFCEERLPHTHNGDIPAYLPVPSSKMHGTNTDISSGAVRQGSYCLLPGYLQRSASTPR